MVGLFGVRWPQIDFVVTRSGDSAMTTHGSRIWGWEISQGSIAGTPTQLRLLLSNLQVVLEGGLNLFLGKRGEGLLLVMASPLRSYAWAFESIASGRPASGADDVP